jgi:hypothetical protein
MGRDGVVLLMSRPVQRVALVTDVWTAKTLEKKIQETAREIVVLGLVACCGDDDCPDPPNFLGSCVIRMPCCGVVCTMRRSQARWMRPPLSTGGRLCGACGSQTHSCCTSR